VNKVVVSTFGVALSDFVCAG